MPSIKKSCSYPSKHHPYFLKEHKQSNEKENNNLKIKCRYSKSCKSNFYSKSTPQIQEESIGLKFSFCGVSSNPDDVLEECNSVNCFGLLIESDNCHASNTDHSTSSPIAVPMRECQKRKLCFHCSGGYLFDKYMKRFQSKCIYSETVDEMTASKFDQEQKEKLLKVNLRSNREDIVYSQPDTGRFCPSLPQINDAFENDNLYYLLYQPTQRFCPHDNLQLCKDWADDNFSSVFPSSPPPFWGDARVGNWKDQDISPIPSRTDIDEVACRYSDSNSESLKALETLYLCNFRVVTDGEWLCLREITDECVPSNVLVNDDLSGLQFIFQLLKKRNVLYLISTHFLNITELLFNVYKIFYCLFLFIPLTCRKTLKALYLRRPRSN